MLLSYGNLTNDFLFMDYGFVISGNPHDRVQLRFGTELVQVRSSYGLSKPGISRESLYW